MNKKILIVGLILLLFFSIIHINQGSVDVSMKTIFDSIFNYNNSLEHNVVRDLRLPRLIIGIIAGGALGISGVLFQSLMRNPLASASTLGINAGSYFVVILFSIFLPNLDTIAFLPAFIGALSTALLVLILGKGNSNTIQITLAGVALSLVFASVTSALQILFENETKGLFLWGSGSLVQNNWNGVKFSFPVVLICFISAIFISRKLDILELGDDLANSLGLNVNFYRLFGIILAVLSVSTVISVVGPIGFVGIVAPHIVKKLGFKKNKDILIFSFLIGSIVLVAADIIARLFTGSSYELPVGAFTAIIGAPWLIYLAFKTSKTLGKSSYGFLVQTSKVRLPFSILILILSLLITFVFILSISNGDISLLSDESAKLIIGKIRLPRVLTAALAGTVLAISGFLLQTVLNNTLADPSTLGITPGSALGALVAIYFLPYTTSFSISLSAFIGAIIASIVIFSLSKKSNYNPTMLILIGMAVTAICDAALNIIIINTTVGKAASLVWLAGSTYGSTWSNVITLLLTILIFGPLAWLISKDLDAVMLGEDVATSIGANVTKVRLIASIIGILLSAIAVSTVGTVGFIGLLAPHMARFINGVKHRKNMIITALIGTLLLLSADYIGRIVIYPNELPSGLVVSIIGAPYFLWLLHSTSKIKR